ncbi:hypothetical protein [Plebeiibacterium sediminum]|uniref:Uncharacterized protein n=1 Tax=Plebeiibacterium sediminum TaxID=2992112 RepID=A0AAE3M449_9BACT|nr:hypothetical protein [Plebeiobacterium sediminum]MCW3786462.1 hypothetical protein [Plebeiobacterium sediminum]
MEISPKDFGLNSRVQLKQLDTNHIAIVKQIKSRIITKDAIKIIEMSDAIKTREPSTKVSLMCNNNICSKSIKLLNDHSIDIIFS